MGAEEAITETEVTTIRAATINLDKEDTTIKAVTTKVMAKVKAKAHTTTQDTTTKDKDNSNSKTIIMPNTQTTTVKFKLKTVTAKICLMLQQVTKSKVSGVI